jgi:hypothetical protein
VDCIGDEPGSLLVTSLMRRRMVSGCPPKAERMK